MHLCLQEVSKEIRRVPGFFRACAHSHPHAHIHIISNIPVPVFGVHHGHDGLPTTKSVISSKLFFPHSICQPCVKHPILLSFLCASDSTQRLATAIAKTPEANRSLFMNHGPLPALPPRQTESVPYTIDLSKSLTSAKNNRSRRVEVRCVSWEGKCSEPRG
jgi:hypothetical protein